MVSGSVILPDQTLLSELLFGSFEWVVVAVEVWEVEDDGGGGVMASSGESGGGGEGAGDGASSKSLSSGGI